MDNFQRPHGHNHQINPDTFVIKPPPHNTPLHPEITLDTYIARSHYERATNRAPEGKALGPDAITNEVIKHLQEAAHTLIYILFQIRAKYNYTP